MISAVFFLVVVDGAVAEIITATDGRKFELNADGTYRSIADSAPSAIQMEESKPYFMPFAGEYNQNSIRFMPIFKNLTGKIIVGFKFHAVFKSAFGDEIFAFDGESSERVVPDGMSTAASFYFFEDNQFINDEPFDRLQIFEAAGTGTIKTAVAAVVFDDGEVVKLE